ncbi:C-type lectin BfL-2-like isoform X2 [Thamnophis elegans]|uniref:C-type lectin BfL-2-like isoform X2 n=1 Tax=Thamnophis elegans TaxID=35005 RepID=UPI0013770D9C|nr:C-type lectin BfL-2-like isoform X2 [Thamnophis elegans]
MGRFIFLTFSLLVVALCLRGAKGYQCPLDWLPGNELCYKVFGERKTWTDAEMFCRKLKPGCHLASIHSKAESADLAEYITHYITRSGQVWIGLNDPKKRRIWEWSDRSSVDYFSWDSGDPDNKWNNELCVHMWSPAGYLKWRDQTCNALHPFICQCKY